MTSKKEHINYWKKQGRFIIDCNTDVFTKEEIEVLEKWGYWFQALCSGKLQPFTMRQEQFISVAKGENDPCSISEVAWDKYRRTKNKEAKPGDEQDRQYLPQEDTFHSRDMAKKLSKMMYGEMKKNHKL